MEYNKIAYAEMSPDVYGGKECNEHIPQWKGSFYEQEAVILDKLELGPESFPPGTRITIEVPVCPVCDFEQEMCECDFDWKAWIESQYS